MSDNKHTPGPRHWHKSRTMRHLHNEKCSCFAQISMPDVTRVDISYVGEYEANARLIAAAPELPEALTFIIEQMSLPENASYTLGSYLHGIGVDNAKLAIAKATGVQK